MKEFRRQARQRAFEGQSGVMPPCLRSPVIQALAFVSAAAAATGAPGPAPVPGSWTLVHLPDTQYYTNNSQRAAVLMGQMAWLAANAAYWDIGMAVHVGDLVESNNDGQWSLVRSAMDQLNGIVPRAMCTGNHDCGPDGSGHNRISQFVRDDRFGAGSPYFAQPTCKGYFQYPGEAAGNTANSWHTFTAGRQEFLVLTCEWGPRDAVVTWMDTMIAARPWHRVIMVVHAWLDKAGRRYDWSASRDSQNPHAFGIARTPGGVNDGEQLWNKVVRRHENIFMVCCGHSLNRAILTSTGDRGNNVFQVLYNVQDLANGGDGWLRLFEFYPDNRTVRARTYSTWRDEWNTSPSGEFVFHLSPVSRADADGDAMPDYFEVQHGFDSGNPADASGDADGDGQPNAAEFLAATDPRNAGDCLRALACTLEGGQCRVRWRSVPGKRYRLESCAPFAPGAWTVAGEHRAIEAEAEMSVPAPAAASGYFRVAAVNE
jgi:hypothetical protein